MPTAEISGGRPEEIQRGSFVRCKRSRSLHFRGMNNEAPFAVEAALRRHFEREAHSQLGVTLRALLRSDADRLVCFDRSQVVDDFDVQRRYLVGCDIEQICMEAAQRDAHLLPAVGYVLSDERSRPERGAWLVRDDGAVVDPARSRRPFLGALGVKLRASEAALWTPSHPGAVGERSVAGLRVA